ncbi:MAG: endonuclease/exonuclease/phosphatase family protein [Myxococcota bacterium]
MLRIMTFNVRYFSHVGWARGLRSRPAGLVRIAEALAAASPPPDVVALQEVEGRSLRARPTLEKKGNQLGVLSEALDFALRAGRRDHRYRATYHPAHIYRVGALRVYTTGLAFLVREGVELETSADTDITHRWLPGTERIKQTRICTHLRVGHEGGQTDLFNTHLSLPSFLSPRMLTRAEKMGYGENQLEEAKRVVHFVRARTADPEQVVLMGDLNSVPTSPVLKLLRRSLQLRDAAAEGLGLGLSALEQERPTFGALHLRKRLDHLLVGRGLRVGGVTSDRDFAPPWLELSDHLPVLAAVEPGAQHGTSSPSDGGPFGP